MWGVGHAGALFVVNNVFLIRGTHSRRARTHTGAIRPDREGEDGLRGDMQVRFVVMNNVFRTDLLIHRKYDLKGSTLGRSSLLDKGLPTVSILKDLDLDTVFKLEEGWHDRSHPLLPSSSWPLAPLQTPPPLSLEFVPQCAGSGCTCSVTRHVCTVIYVGACECVFRRKRDSREALAPSHTQVGVG